MLDTLRTLTADRPAFDAARCLRCLAGTDPAKRACAAARLMAAGLDPDRLDPATAIRQ